MSDGGAVSHSRVATVVLNVLDDNDEVPTFIRTSYVFHVPENRAPGSAVGRVRATDADLSGQHRSVANRLLPVLRQLLLTVSHVVTNYFLSCVCWTLLLSGQHRAVFYSLEGHGRRYARVYV